MDDKKTILILEDNIDYRELITNKLTSEGFRPMSTDDGNKALEWVKTEKIDLILLDLMMPKMNGADFVEQLAKNLKKFIPIVVLTNLPVPMQHPYVVDFLVKSNIAIQDIIFVIKQHLAKHELHVSSDFVEQQLDESASNK